LDSNPSRLRLQRIHVLPSPRSLGEASAFIVNALLLSHGIRKESVAIVRVGGEWIYAPGASIRHLRPDADSSEGWLRAVLRGRELGAQRLEKFEPPSEALRICLRCGLKEDLDLGLLKSVPLEAADAIYVFYTSTVEDIEVSNLCRESVWGAIPLRPRFAVAVVNTILDRIEAGMSPLIDGALA
jgi:hypothetical protein